MTWLARFTLPELPPKAVLLLASAGLAWGGPSTLPAQETREVLPPEEEEAPGSLRVRVRWKGELPELEPLELPADFRRRHPEAAEFCQGCMEAGKLRREDLEVQAEGRGIRNVAVSLPRVRAAGPELPRATVDNTCGRFAPRVQFAPVGEPLLVRNSDPFAHNARIFRGGRQVWNALLGAGDEVPTPEILVAGLYELRCDIHPWMKGWVIASKSPLCAVSGADGEARIEGVEPGEDHQVVLWHEHLGQLRRKVRVPPGETLTLELDQHDFRR